MVKLSLIIFSLFCLKAFAGTTVIYGDDNRLDWYESSNTMHRELSLSTAAMIDKKQLLNKTDYIKISGITLRGRGICESERFSEQITAANCSGFLVGEDLLVTAGHCIETQADCAKYSWVFNYKKEFKEHRADMVPKNDVYNCSQIIERKLETFGKNDYALIRLNRKVTGRTPLKYRTEGKPDKGDNLVVIGHPSGLPTKIADGAKIRSLKSKYFKANLDTYGGNSGSAVFNSDTGIIEGILVRGATDYVSRNGCRESNRVSNSGGRGEDVTFITNIKTLTVQ
jgi:V8-like Glu-specific endopeptidase